MLCMLPAMQAVVDAVVVLLESGAFDTSSSSGSGGSLGVSPEVSSAAAGAAGAAPAAETSALQFLAAHLAANRAVVSGGVLLRVLQHLAATGAPAADMSPAEREAVFCDVVAADGSRMGPADLQQVRESRQQGCCLLLAASGQAGFAARQHEMPLLLTTKCVCGHLFCRPSSWRGGWASCRPRRGFGTQRAPTQRRWPAWRGIPGALGASKLHIWHFCVAALRRSPCPLQSRQQPSYSYAPTLCRHPAAAFKYVRDVLVDSALAQQQRDAFTKFALGQAPQLLALDADAASQVGGGCCGVLHTAPALNWLLP